jgi:TonB family protein
MKKIFNIILVVVAIILISSCGSKTEQTSTTAVVESGDQKEVLSVADRKARIEELEKLAAISPTYTNAKGEIVYNKAEKDPSYDGGNNAMIAYLHDNLQFPKDAQDKQLEGTVFVDFVITKNGNVQDVEVTDLTNENVDQSFREEAIRVVTAMPKWLPGLQRGKAVDVKYSLPVTFELL